MRGGDDNGAVMVGDYHLAGIDRDAAAANRLLPALEDPDLSQEGGAAVPCDQTGRPVARTPAMSRTTPSVISPATCRLIMRAQRISPKMPASTTPDALATTRHPGGISSIATRVERGEDQASGGREILARRNETQGEGRTDHAALPLTLRPRATHPDVSEPLFNSSVVIVAVETPCKISMIALGPLS